MVGKWQRPGRYRGSCGRQIGLLILLVTATLLTVWKKVELASTLQQVDRDKARLSQLKEERAKLTAAVAFRKKPGAIEGIARGRLGMDYHRGQLTYLSFEPREQRRRGE